MKRFTFKKYAGLEKFSNIHVFIILILLMIILFQGMLVNVDRSPTYDERCYIGSGKYMLTTGNFKDYTALSYHPPLAYYINSIFLYTFDFPDTVYDSNNCWEVGNNIIFHSGYDHTIIIFLARLPFIIMSMILGFVVLKFAQYLYGVRGALLALFLYTFNIGILSHTNLAYTDFPVAFFVFLTVFFFWRFMKFHKTWDVVLTALFFGCGLLSKLTGIMLFPALVGILIIEGFRRRFSFDDVKKYSGYLIAIFVCGVFMLWAGHGFAVDTIKDSWDAHYASRASEEIEKISHPIVQRVAYAAFEEIPVPFPSYFHMFANLRHHSSIGRYRFFFGELQRGFMPYYPAVLFLLKTQLSLLVLFFVALFLFVRRLIIKKTFSHEFYLLIPMGILFFLFMINNMTAAITHLIPAYPFIILFVSSFALRKDALSKLLLVVVIVHYLLSWTFAYPFYFAYFNELGGGRDNGYKILGDGNLDSGQYLPVLKKYMDENAISSIPLSYLGSVDPVHYGITYEYMASPSFQPWVPGYTPFSVNSSSEVCGRRTGLFAVSVLNLQNTFMLNKTCYSWLWEYEPIEKIAGSIFIYNITE